VAEISIKGFGMEVLAYDPYIEPKAVEETDIVLCEDMEEVIRTADFLSLHVPLTKETQGLMGPKQFDLMKPTAFIINTSRGEMIQEVALVEALKNERIAGAGLDVFEKEPPGMENPLFQMENVILSPHSAALTKEVVAKLAEGAAKNVLNVLENKPPSYSINWEEVQAKTGKKKN
jgi:D-3-phosphoglycerate dehydrogenase